MQRAGKIVGIIGEEGVSKRGRPICHRGDEQGAVGQRLGTRYADSGVERMLDGLNFE